MTDVRELLPLYALGILDAGEAAAVERAVAADPQLATELAALADVAAQLAAAPAPAIPDEDVELRLLASIGGGRFEHYAARMGDLFDVSVDRAREILALIERKASWEQPIPGIGVELVDFTGGPRCAGADCGFVRLAPGAAFPAHTHLGPERTLVLAGTLLDRTSGRRHGPGDEMVQGPGETQHDITAETEEVIYAALAVDGIQLAGTSGRAKM
jgi:putative transcriptional regulator